MTFAAKRLQKTLDGMTMKEPDNDEELSACEEALEGCPVEAIGDDGE